MMPPRLKMTSGYAWLVPVACSGLLTSGVIGNAPCESFYPVLLNVR